MPRKQQTTTKDGRRKRGGDGKPILIWPTIAEHNEIRVAAAQQDKPMTQLVLESVLAAIRK